MFLQPNTMRGRFEKAYNYSYKKLNPQIKKQKLEKNYMNFLYENYVRNYPKIAKGKLPHQKIFGSFSYNGHSLGNNNAIDYKEFSPEKIISIERIAFKFDKEGNFINSTTINSIKIKN